MATDHADVEVRDGRYLVVNRAPDIEVPDIDWAEAPHGPRRRTMFCWPPKQKEKTASRDASASWARRCSCAS